MSNRPNILYIFTDQQYAGVMSCAGNRDVSTPAMDGLAATGTRFEQAYCTQPLCSPSRASMFYGRMPSQLGMSLNARDMNMELPLPEMGHLFRQNGYACAYGGKYHLPPRHLHDGEGFEYICRQDDAQLPVQCVEFMRRTHDRPWLLVASFDNPHNICQYARNQNLPRGPVPEPPSLEACPNLPANFAIPAFEPECIRVEQQSNHAIHPNTLDWPQEQWRRYRWAYYRMVEKVDGQVGQILKGLRDLGLEENTLVIFTSDHGDGHGAHRWNQKSCLYEETVRIPLIVSLKGMTKAGHVDREHLVSNGLDLMPTLCDYAGIPQPPELPGRSFRPLAEGREVDWREDLAIQTVFPGGRGYDTAGRVLRTPRYKYTIYSWGGYREQLCDMQADPGEMVNLAVEQRYQEVLADHRRRLAAWCERIGDRFAQGLGGVPLGTDDG